MVFFIDVSFKLGEVFDGCFMLEFKWWVGICVGDKVIFELENIVRKLKLFDEKKMMFFVQMCDEIGVWLINI